MSETNRPRAFSLRTFPAALLAGLSPRVRAGRVRTARLLASAALLLLVALPGAADAHARVLRAHRHGRLSLLAHSLFNVPLPAAGLLPLSAEELPTDGKRYELKLARPEDGQSVDVVYRIGDIYIPQALNALNQFLHDSHDGEIASYDPRTFDVLHTVLAKLGRADSLVDILSAYRTQETNDFLREQGGTNAAQYSQHIVAKALDIRVSGVSAFQLRDAALSLHAGGVGYYPSSQFVHIDTGPVRQWTFSPHAARLRSGRGLHHGRSRGWHKRRS